MKNVILDELPDFVEIDGREYPIITDFRNWLDFSRIINAPGITEYEVIRSFEAVMEEIPAGVEPIEIAGALIDFMNERKKKEKKPDEPVLMRDIMKPLETAADEPDVLDYDFDSAYIFAAFMQQYGINLKESSFHWYEFKALFSGLNKECKIIEIIGYRAVNDSDYGQMSKAERAHIKKMKKMFALPERRTPEQIEQDFANGL